MAKLFAIFILIAVFGACLGQQRPAGWVYGNDIVGRDANIISEHFQIIPNEGYKFGYKQDDLQERDETGKLIFDEKDKVYKIDNVIGSYKYVRPDGLWQIVEYRADTKGFAPKIRTEAYNRIRQ